MGPLAGYKIVEIAGIGPGQYCGMLLADMGAQLIRVERPVTGDLGFPMPARFNLMNRSRHTINVDLKTGEGADLVLRLCESADAIFEGFRPGVMERLGLGPEECMDRNKRLVYGRMTGYGQEGPLANTVGHDTNYIALAGALHAIGDADRPPPVPLNLIGDLGGGGIFLAMGMLAAMLEASKSGKGQVVDAAMVDGVASMLTGFHGLLAGGFWRDQRQSNLLDGGAPFVKVYQTQDDKYVSVCAIENRFYKALLDALDITTIDAADQHERDEWAKHEAIIAAGFRTKTRDEWSDIFAGTDACAAPVLSLREARSHAHNKARGVFVTVDGIEQPGPAPRFSRTPSEISSAPNEPGSLDEQVLAAWGLDEDEIGRFLVPGNPSRGSSA
jgi:alpha-methylacyl-CoA racemase